MKGGLQPVALVLDAHTKSSLAAIRSLGRRGIKICAGSHRRTAMGLRSRYVTSKFVYPSPLESAKEFVSAVAQKRDVLGNVVLLGFSDSTILPLVRDRDFLDARTAFVKTSDVAKFESAFDKAQTIQLAESLGIEIPETHIWSDSSDFSRLARDLCYPVVVKPRHSVSWRGETGVQRTSLYAISPDDLKQKCAEMLAETGEVPLVQEFIRGEEAGVEFLCDRGAVLGSCAHRRIRSLSPTGGQGVLSETVPLSQHGLGKLAARLASALEWSGPMMVEFKIEQKSGVPRLMEINGRFWGSLPLAISAGCDFPYLYYRLACDGEIRPSGGHREGVISRHLLGDVNNLWRTLFQIDPIRSFAYPRRLGALREFFHTARAWKSDVWDANDIKPGFAELWDSIGRIDFAGLRFVRRNPATDQRAVDSST